MFPISGTHFFKKFGFVLKILVFDLPASKIRAKNTIFAINGVAMGPFGLILKGCGSE